jgi:hypothetical protein
MRCTRALGRDPDFVTSVDYTTRITMRRMSPLENGLRRGNERRAAGAQRCHGSKRASERNGSAFSHYYLER